MSDGGWGEPAAAPQQQKVPTIQSDEMSQWERRKADLQRELEKMEAMKPTITMGTLPTPEPSPVFNNENFSQPLHAPTSKARPAYSPGYGQRPAPGTNQGPVPPPETLVTMEGSHHRIYPAPAPLSPPIDVNNGWSTDQAQDKAFAPSIQARQSQQLVEVDMSEETPKLSVTLSQGSFIPWDGGVKYTNPQEEEQEQTTEELLSCLNKMKQEREDRVARLQGGVSNGGIRQSDDGYTSRKPTGNCYNCGQEGHTSRDCPTGGQGGNSSSGCRKCGEEGHFARECPQGGGYGGGGGSLTCYKCGEAGHMSRDCPQADGGGGPRTCYNCGEEGHMSRECQNPSKGGGGGGQTCYSCGEQGHRSFECPTKQDGDRAGRGGGERRGGGAGSGGWGGNTQDQGWGSGGGGNETSQNQNWGSGGNDNSAGDGGGWGSMPGGQDSNGKGDIASGNGNKDDGWGAPTPSAKHLKKPETGGWSGQAQPNAQDSRTEAQPSNGGWSSQSQPASSDQINNEGEGGGNAPPVRRPEPQIHPDRLKQVPGGMNSVARNGGRARDADFQRGPIPNRQQPMAQGGDGGWGARQNSQGAGSEPPQAAVYQPPAPASQPPPADDEFGGW